uniref:WGS project CBMI000000000 data, contig CS3069_c002217 n=1 Tax=Fusarium clavum TaxID=2594811 RepID=A0A090N5N8_9HYPO|nr:unnamed protein product [Fusarium clavum]
MHTAITWIGRALVSSTYCKIDRSEHGERNNSFTLDEFRPSLGLIVSGALTLEGQFSAKLPSSLVTLTPDGPRPMAALLPAPTQPPPIVANVGNDKMVAGMAT